MFSWRICRESLPSLIVTNDRIADLIERLQTKGIDPTPWLERVKITY